MGRSTYSDQTAEIRKERAQKREGERRDSELKKSLVGFAAKVPRHKRGEVKEIKEHYRQEDIPRGSISLGTNSLLAREQE